MKLSGYAIVAFTFNYGIDITNKHIGYDYIQHVISLILIELGVVHCVNIFLSS